MKKEKKQSIAVTAATKMPKLVHNNSDPFDILKSQVVNWLVLQPPVLQALFDFYREKGAIIFDPDSKTWRGNPKIIQDSDPLP